MKMLPLVIEGRYDSIVTQLSRKLLTVIKQSYTSVSDPRGQYNGQQIYFDDAGIAPNILDDSKFRHIYMQEVENSKIPLDFYVELKVQWIRGFRDFRYGADAYNNTTIDSNTPPLIEVRFMLDPDEYPGILNEVAVELRDILRHEIEHITQSGWNTLPGKYIASDQPMRKKIETGKIAAARYFTLPKEIPAMIQGLYHKAKKTKQPFSQVVNRYLGIWERNGTLTKQDKEYILNVWRTYLPKLSIRQEL
jgi:hypothetical protein